VYIGDTNIAALVTKIYTDAQARRTQAPDMAKWMQDNRGARPSGITGLRIISIWNQCGGSGKSTIAANMAYEAARRGLRTLLIGLGAPDILPLMLGLQAEPNITLWQANPTNEAFKNAVQRVSDLDVIAGFPTVIAQEQMVSVSADKKESLNTLVMTAAYSGYGVIILDTPHTPIAALAISTANTLLLVARPTIMDTWAAVEAYRTVQGRMSGQHRIAPENMFVALNRLHDKSMSSNDWHNAASGTLNRSFPPVLATFGDDPDIEKAQGDGKLPIMVCKEFARSMNTLTDLIFGGVGKPDKKKKEDSGGFKFGKFKFKIGESNE
jgi:cellulose biosynthesis protein BcsQ